VSVDYADLQQDDNFLTQLDRAVWLMDNHKWALYAWQVTREELGLDRFALVHADYHWDGVDDFLDYPDRISELLAADAGQLRQMTAENTTIRFDSFIAPAVRRSMLREVHFYCEQTDGQDIGIDAQILSEAGTAQFVHVTAVSLRNSNPVSPLIFDLCLDLFNRSDHFQTGDLWPDPEVLEFLEVVSPLIVRAEAVTVSMSFDYSGDANDTRHLTSLVVPRILELRSHAPL